MSDGKGDYSFTFDFSESKALLEIISAYKTAEGKSIFQAKKFKKPLALISNDLNGIPGIYNCKEVVDTVHWKLGLQFAFVDVNALNHALGKIDGKEEVNYLKVKKKKAEWTQNIDWMEVITSNLPQSIEAKKTMLQTLDTAHYHFKWKLNREIKTIKSYEIEQLGSNEVIYQGAIPNDENYKYITQWNIKFKK